MLDRLHHMETLAAIQEGMASAERGERKPAAQVLDEMRAKYGLSVSLAAPAEVGFIPWVRNVPISRMCVQNPIWQWAIAKLTGPDNPSVAINTEGLIPRRAFSSASSPSPTGAC